jgi:hypothetical protein
VKRRRAAGSRKCFSSREISTFMMENWQENLVPFSFAWLLGRINLNGPSGWREETEENNRHHAAATAVRLRLAEAGDTQPGPKSLTTTQQRHWRPSLKTTPNKLYYTTTTPFFFFFFFFLILFLTGHSSPSFWPAWIIRRNNSQPKKEKKKDFV